MGISVSKRLSVFRESNGTCFLCGRIIAESELSLHHVLPRTHGGTNASGNLVATHTRCNLEAGDRLPDEQEFERLLALKKLKIEQIPRDHTLRKLLRLYRNGVLKK